MHIRLLVTAVIGAAIAQIAASPLRVVIVSNNQATTTPKNLRYGHALADSPVAKMTVTNSHLFIDEKSAGPLHRPPCNKRIKEKAIRISNAFRQALGLPLIESTQPKPGDHVHGGIIRILPFIGTPPTFAGSPGTSSGKMEDRPLAHPRVHVHHHHGHAYPTWNDTFWMRIHDALMALGPWEGRAVAFVLGCGIGVLLRMVWVLTVVTYRAIRGEHEQPDYTPIAVIEEYIETDGVPPPSYTDVNEKQQIKATEN